VEEADVVLASYCRLNAAPRFHYEWKSNSRS